MTSKNEHHSRGIEGRFHDLSADVREERLIRYILHQIETGRRVDDIVNDAYVVEHFDEVARGRILEHPDVIKSIEASMRRQVAGRGASVVAPDASGEDQDPAGRSDNAELSDL